MSCDETLIFSYPQIERYDTYTFKHRSSIVANSITISVFDPNHIRIVELAPASYNPVNSYYYYHYTDPGSWYTTVDSLGKHVFQWDITDQYGYEHHHSDYFEIIHKNGAQLI